MARASTASGREGRPRSGSRRTPPRAPRSLRRRRRTPAPQASTPSWKLERIRARRRLVFRLVLGPFSRLFLGALVLLREDLAGPRVHEHLFDPRPSVYFQVEGIDEAAALRFELGLGRGGRSFHRIEGDLLGFEAR